MTAAQRHSHGIFEKHRCDGFRLMHCTIADCRNANFVHRRFLEQVRGPWRCGMHQAMHLIGMLPQPT